MLFRNTNNQEELKLSYVNINTAKTLHDIWIEHLQSEREQLVKDWVIEHKLNQNQAISGSFFAR